LFFTCTNTSQAATCTCNTWPRISPHNVVNHSSHKEATIHWSSNHTWSSNARARARTRGTSPHHRRYSRDSHREIGLPEPHRSSRAALGRP
jgi:hypothetical protein